ncbi:hypothetical protein M427DRAFT_51047 [Gonapodya prolifera JEL478]|uniref:Dihydroorotate dehydrogenase (quinone), mitochondrial n=1 Tax=Gonapodya prolifera (strain JEL478) TaxID=1344416 RepID=A0A139AY32_GONPJ|nr:hypothetical protein M427DRAFT_51047 [Gonapodya prolifera JEL478]|eukprot:KXS21629.1 hypothetical protein M427DRAFT_51047 [Gonapodya prolifera JEL478]
MAARFGTLPRTAAAIARRPYLGPSRLRSPIQIPTFTSRFASTTSYAPPKEPTLSQELLVPHYRSFLRLLLAGTVGALVVSYLYDSRAAVHELVIMPLVHKTMDPEEAHRLAIWLAKNGLSPVERGSPDDKLLEVHLFGKTLKNPIGLAAGFDKNGEAIDGMFDMGFGIVEIGSVVPRPQPGNPKPRMFRLSPDTACINRYGMNCAGFDDIEARLRSRVRSYLRAHPDIHLATSPSSVAEELAPLGASRSLRGGRMLGINLARNKGQPSDSNDDYVEGVHRMGPYADYVVLNVSCPNQHGITSMQRKGIMEGLMKEIIEARNATLPHRPPVLVKLSPDLDDAELADVARAVVDAGVDGVIISNTTNQRPSSLKSDPKITSEWGGLSGPPLKPLSLHTIRTFRRLTSGAVPIVGCGGILTGADALEYARAGASAIQLYTGMAFDGPGVVARIKREVKEELGKMGKTWEEVVGNDAVGSR